MTDGIAIAVFVVAVGVLFLLFIAWLREFTRYR